MNIGKQDKKFEDLHIFENIFGEEWLQKIISDITHPFTKWITNPTPNNVKALSVFKNYIINISNKIGTKQLQMIKRNFCHNEFNSTLSQLCIANYFIYKGLDNLILEPISEGQVKLDIKIFTPSGINLNVECRLFKFNGQYDYEDAFDGTDLESIKKINNKAKNEKKHFSYNISGINILALDYTYSDYANSARTSRHLMNKFNLNILPKFSFNKMPIIDLIIGFIRNYNEEFPIDKEWVVNPDSKWFKTNEMEEIISLWMSN